MTQCHMEQMAMEQTWHFGPSVAKFLERFFH